MDHLNRVFLALLVLGLVSGCFGIAKQKDLRPAVYFMQYNVENLFDTKHDQGKDDYAFLPKELKTTAAHKKFCSKIKVPKWKSECLDIDWSEKMLQGKMQRLADTILAYNPPKGPDVLFLQEVENKEVLERLNKDYLKGAYKVLLIEGQDKRGIDVAILSKLEIVAEPKLHKIPYVKVSTKIKEDSRGILEAKLKLPDSTPLTVFALHLPNPMHPAEARTQALNHLKTLVDPSVLTVAAGDLNITGDEDRELSRKEVLSKDWLVAHKIGCSKCLGSHYYRPKNSWSFLDWMLFSPNLAEEASGKWMVDKASIDVFKGHPAQTNQQGHPMAFDGVEKPEGVSDHLPIVGRIVQK